MMAKDIPERHREAAADGNAGQIALDVGCEHKNAGRTELLGEALQG